jgi:malate dehydrogenase (oxaloacetate-decarboxylating)(NADP+)
MDTGTIRATEDEALSFHASGRPGKLSIAPTKPLTTQRDLSLAYSPGVAFPCLSIERQPDKVYDYTSKGNFVAVVSNGTAVLGLGDLGALAAKPVMEGKCALFKRFADIDSIDLEIDTRDVDEFVNCVRFLHPAFGGINLEDIKAPECFVIEERLRELLDIPVFHDDQHGTAIIAAAGLINALHLTGRELQKIRMVVNGAGAAGIACVDLLKTMGLPPGNAVLCDTRGVIYRGREQGMNQWKSAHAVDTKARTLAEAIEGADVFFGLSVKGAVSQAMVRSMADKPIIFAMANPDPEITPEAVKAVRADAIIATGRSDYPNQVNNVLCFPFLFRGALDVGATTINEAMKKACAEALAALARAEPSDIVAAAYGGESPSFGPDYLIPRPFDPRLIVELASAVAKAAMESGVATRPIADFAAYRERLSQHVFRTGLVMKPLFERAGRDPRRVVFAEGEDERVLRAAQTVIDEKLAKPILIGRGRVVESRLRRLGLRLKPGEDFELVDPQSDSRYEDYWRRYHRLMERRGVTPEDARNLVRTETTIIAALMVKQGDADAMLCGTAGRYPWHLEHVRDIVGLKRGVQAPSALHVLVLPKGVFFLCDTQVTAEPTAEGIVEMTRMAAEEMRRFGIEPKAALLSHSSFGASDAASAKRMRAALALLRAADPHLEVEGEMQAELAVSSPLRQRLFPNSILAGQANLLVLPSLDAANIALGLLRHLGEGIAVGPILMGAAAPAHILTPSVSVRGIVNMTAVAVAEAQESA